MKNCPKCGQSYSDDTLNFCLADGSALIVPNFTSEATVVMESATPPAVTHSAKRNANPSLAYIIIGLLALVAGGAVVALLMSRSSGPSIPQANTSSSNNTPANATNRSNGNSEVVRYPDSVTQALTADSVKNLLSVWKRAQEAKSFASYQACYDASFVGVKKTKSGHSQSYDYSSWMADRRRMIESAVNLNIDMSNLQVRVEGDSAVVEFDQYYRSLRYSDWGPKEITVRMTPSGPKIVREELKASYPL